jgi:uncharacterized protein
MGKTNGTINCLIDTPIRQYIQILRENRFDVWRLYLFGSHAKGTAREDSDIDLAIFLDRDEIDKIDEDVQLLRLASDIDFRIEPHSFSRKDFGNADPFIREIITTGKRIL